jgi:hypothetical protein
LNGEPRLLATAALRIAGLFILTALAACSSVGPTTVTRDRFDYISSISESWKRQMLLNLLKVRYSDAPVFLDVASVINSYEVHGEVDLAGQVTPSGRNGDTFAGVAGSAFYADKPTITYTPLSGDKFAKSIMNPLPVGAILLLVQSGYPVDSVLRVCVNTVNGLENAYGGHGPRPGNPKVFELLTLLREDQAAGGFGLQIKTKHNKQATVMYFRPPTDEAMATRHRRIIELLGLNAKDSEFTVGYGSFADDDTEIALQTRSMLQVLVDVASYVDVPAADAAEGRVFTPPRTPEQERMFPPLLRVRTGPVQPADAYVSVRYREQWFWIDDRDPTSKTAFNFLMLMFSLTETGAPTQAAPVVTVPAR